MNDITDGMKVADILAQYPQLNFVQRIVHPERSPSIPDPNDPKRSMTHFMASGESDGRGVVYPRVVEVAPGELRLLDPDEAWKYAVSNRELIEFPTPQEAEWFAKNYKMFWNDSGP